MRNLILILFTVFSLNLSAQFTSTVQEDAFDGDVVLVFGRGEKGRFPYQDPVLVFRHKAEKFEFYIKGAGYVNGDNKTLKVIIDKDKTKLYTFNLSASVGGDAGFIYADEDTTLRFIEDLQKGSRAYFRFETDYSFNTFEMSLSGANESLNMILPLIKEKYEAKAAKDKAIKEKIDELFANDLDVLNNKTGMVYSMFPYYLEKQNIDIFSVDSIVVKRKSYGTARIFVVVNGEEIKVDGYFFYTK